MDSDVGDKLGSCPAEVSQGIHWNETLLGFVDSQYCIAGDEDSGRLMLLIKTTFLKHLSTIENVEGLIFEFSSSVCSESYILCTLSIREKKRKRLVVILCTRSCDVGSV